MGESVFGFVEYVLPYFSSDENSENKTSESKRSGEEGEDNIPGGIKMSKEGGGDNGTTTGTNPDAEIDLDVFLELAGSIDGVTGGLAKVASAIKSMAEKYLEINKGSNSGPPKADSEVEGKGKGQIVKTDTMWHVPSLRGQGAEVTYTFENGEDSTGQVQIIKYKEKR